MIYRERTLQVYHVIYVEHTHEGWPLPSVESGLISPQNLYKITLAAAPGGSSKNSESHLIKAEEKNPACCLLLASDVQGTTT